MTTQDININFALGPGAVQDEGVPIDIQFGNCLATFWVRALDGNAAEDLAKEGVDLAKLLSPGGDSADPEAEERDVAEVVTENMDKTRAIVSRLCVRWEGLKRTDDTTIKYSEDARRLIAGYPAVVTAIILASVKACGELEGNSETSSDGTPPESQSDEEPSDESEA